VTLRFQGHVIIIDVLDVLYAQLTRDLFAIVKFFYFIFTGRVVCNELQKQTNYTDVEVMAAAVDIRACVSSLTKCPICLENFDQPKSLPCLHTYCLKCLKSLCQSVRPGQKKPCPKCRKEFRIPGGGVDDLPSNFDMVALLEAHRGVEYCEQHADEAMKLYCFDCNSDICVLCFALAHAQHRCDDVKTVAERFRQQIDRDVERVFSRFDEIQNAVQQLNDEHQRYDAETKQLVAAIRHQGKIFKQFIDRQVNSLIQRAETMKNETLGDIQQHKERLELSLAALESFKSYSHEIKTKSRVRNMMRVASDLRDRVDDLLRSSVSLRDYRAPVISFVPTDFMRLMRSAKIEQDFIGKLSNITTTGIPLILLCTAITSAKEQVMLSVLSVCLFVCLFVCHSVCSITYERVYGFRPNMVGMCEG